MISELAILILKSSYSTYYEGDIGPCALCFSVCPLNHAVKRKGTEVQRGSFASDCTAAGGIRIEMQE